MPLSSAGIFARVSEALPNPTSLITWLNLLEAEASCSPS